MANIIYEDSARGLVIQRDRTPGDELIALLERTVWGTHGLRYRVHRLVTTLDRIPDPHFLTLTVRGQTIAGAVRSKKTLEIGGVCCQAVHLAMLAVDAARIGQGYGKLLTEQSRHYFLQEMTGPGLLYGYIESGNTRSLELNRRLGYRTLGVLGTMAFSRIRPKILTDVEALDARDKERIVRVLSEQYAGFSMVDFADSIRPREYFVLRSAGRIVAGIQVERIYVSFEKLPGLCGATLLSAPAWVPGLSRVFNPDYCSFLRLANIYVRPGHETGLLKLIESVLAQYQVHLGIALMDERSPVRKRISHAGGKGLLQLGIRAKFEAIADFNGLPESAINELYSRPLCVSAIDVL